MHPEKPAAAMVPVSSSALERPQMVGDLSSTVGSWPTWAKWLLGIAIVAAFGAVAWAFLHKPSSKAHRRMAASEAYAARRHHQREKKHRAAAKKAAREEAKRRRARKS